MKSTFHPFTLALALCLGFVALSVPAFSYGKVDEAGVMLRDLRSADPELYGPAITYFVNNPDDRAIDGLIGLLKKPDDDKYCRNKLSAINALKTMHDAKTIPALTERIDDADFSVRIAAIEALGTFQDEQVVKTLWALVPGEDVFKGSAAKKALGNAGPIAVRKLLGVLKNATDRQTTIEILGELKDRRAVPALIGVISDNYSSGKPSALEALGKIKDPRGLEALLVIDKEKQKWLREYQITALGNFTDQRAFNLLIAALGDEDAKIRGKAAAALGNVGDRRAVPHLIAALSDKDAIVPAIYALGKLHDPRAVEPLIGLLSNKQLWVASSAIQALGAISDQRAIEPLIAMLKQSDDDSLRKTIIQVLAFIPTENPDKSVSAIEDIVKSDAPLEIRDAATIALGEICTENSQPIVQFLISSLPGGRYLNPTMQSLIHIGTPAVPALLDALKDPNPRIREEVAHLFEALPDDRAVEPLISSLKDEDKNVRYTALITLAKGHFRNVPVKPLMELMSDIETSKLMWAVMAIGEHPDPTAVDPVSAVLLDTKADKSTRTRAADTLWRIGDRRAINPLMQALREENSPIKPHIVRALYGLTGMDFGEDAAKWQEWWDKQDK